MFGALPFQIYFLVVFFMEKDIIQTTHVLKMDGVRTVLFFFLLVSIVAGIVFPREQT